MHFSDHLEQRIKDKKTPFCLGLDPRYEKIPDALKRQFMSETEGLEAFCKVVIDQVHDLVSTIKIQGAFFFLFGSEGVKVLVNVLHYAKKKGLIVILDVKVGDIGSTSEAYAKAYLSKESQVGASVDALTVSPYLGRDSMQPFLDVALKEQKGVFILAKTSNPGSSDIQDLKVEDGEVCQKVAGMIDELGAKDVGKNGLSSVGAVVGATYPEHAKILRIIMPHTWFLVPGFGTQGGTLETVKPAFLPNGMGALVVSAREINFAHTLERYKHLKYQDAIRASAEDTVAALSGIVS